MSKELDAIELLRIRCDTIDDKVNILADGITQVEESLQESTRALQQQQSQFESKSAAFLAGAASALLLAACFRPRP